MFIRTFYIIIDFIFIRKLYLSLSYNKDCTGHIYKNVFYIMKLYSLESYIYCKY